MRFEIFGKPPTIIAHFEDELSLFYRLERDLNAALSAVWESVFERVRDELVHNETAGDGLLDIKPHGTDAGIHCDFVVRDAVEIEQRVGDFPQVGGDFDAREAFALEQHLVNGGDGAHAI